MNVKYELTNEYKYVRGQKVYRIRALKDFGGIKRGTLGGFVQSTSNLSQLGNCWIHDNACILNTACIYNNVQLFDNSLMYENAEAYDNVKVYKNVIISGSAHLRDEVIITDNARIQDNALIHGNTRVCKNAAALGNARSHDNVIITDNAIIQDNTLIHDNAKICDDAQIRDRAEIGGDAKICKDVIIDKYAVIETGCITRYSSIIDKLKAQCLANVTNNKTVLYKRVKKIKEGVYASLYDSTFLYKDGEMQVVVNPEISNKVCTSGIHLSHPTYWHKGDTLIACEVNINDVITIQGGKIRCSKCKTLGEVK